MLVSAIQDADLVRAMLERHAVVLERHSEDNEALCDQT
jgi:hypothetical protein